MFVGAQIAALQRVAAEMPVDARWAVSSFAALAIRSDADIGLAVPPAWAGDCVVERPAIVVDAARAIDARLAPIPAPGFQSDSRFFTLDTETGTRIVIQGGEPLRPPEHASWRDINWARETNDRHRDALVRRALRAHCTMTGRAPGGVLPTLSPGGVALCALATAATPQALSGDGAVRAFGALHLAAALAPSDVTTTIADFVRYRRESGAFVHDELRTMSSVLRVAMHHDSPLVPAPLKPVATASLRAGFRSLDGNFGRGL